MPSDAPLRPIERLDDLIPDERNANRGTERGQAMVEHSLTRYGAGRSILVDRNGRIIAGNKTTEAAVAAGFEKVRVVETEGDELVVVRRMDLDLDDLPARALALADNRTSEIGLEWDSAEIDRLWAENREELAPLFAQDEIQAILDADAANREPDPEGLPDPGADLDRGEELREKWGVELGQVWEIPGLRGQKRPHLMICADSADPMTPAVLFQPQDVDPADRWPVDPTYAGVLMATDPPYGVEFGKANHNPRAKDWPAVTGDDRDGAELRAWLGGVLTTWLPFMAPDAAFYIWSASLAEGHRFYEAIQDAGLHIQSQVIWAKNVFNLGQADYQWKHEPCWYAYRKGAGHRWFGGRKQTTVWEISRLASAAYIHPMQKPVELYAIPIANHTRPGELILDPFAGCGTSTVAAEQAGRTCLSAELDPKHVAVALERFAGMGLSPVLARQEPKTGEEDADMAGLAAVGQNPRILRENDR